MDVDRWLADTKKAAAARQSTHWVGCWRAHHACAVAIIERVLDGAIDESIRHLIDPGSAG